MIFAELSQRLAAGNVPPCLIVSDEDAYWSTKAVNAIRAVCDPMELSVVYPPETVQEGLFKLGCVTFFGGLRAVIFKEFFSLSAADKKRFADYALSPIPDSVLVFVGKALSPTPGFEIVDCSKQGGGAIANETRSLLSAYGKSVTSDALALLIDYCESEMAKIETECRKLCAYAVGEITASDVRTCVIPSINYRAYMLGDFVAAGDYEKAYSLIGDASEAGGLLYLLTGFYRSVFYSKICPQTDLSKCLKLKEYPLKKAKNTSSKYTPMALYELLMLLYRLEFDFKSGRTTAEQALELAIAEAIERRRH